MTSTRNRPRLKRTVPIRDEVGEIFAALTGVPDLWCPEDGLLTEGFTVYETEAPCL